jgi:hypothetical protein
VKSQIIYFLKIVDIFIFEGVGKEDLLPASRLATD